MHGPVDHLHPALAELGAEYVVNTVAVRPGFPMLLARVTGADGRTRFVAGLPGNPQSAIVALVSLVAPLLAGLHGRPMPLLPHGHPGRAGRRPGRLHPPGAGPRSTRSTAPPARSGTSARRCCAGWRRRDGFAVIAPGSTGEAGARVPVVPLPLLPGASHDSAAGQNGGGTVSAPTPQV